jgi:zinc and cadmium transporter
MPVVTLTYYCALILVASIIGGMIPVWFQLTHRWMQFAVSFVAGVMLGVAVLDMLPHAIADAAAATAAAALNVTNDATSGTASDLTMKAAARTMTALLAGMLAMFFIERFFSFHHHDAPGDGHDSDLRHEPEHVAREGHAHHAHIEHRTDLSWSGATLGLALHSILNGVALAASVTHGSHDSRLAGLATFLVVFLHKPFDAMTIGMLMARGGHTLVWRHTVNALFSLAIPFGALLFYFGIMTEGSNASDAARNLWVAYALAFSAGAFLCISLSDLLPELQFHHHDRGKLSMALLFGLGLAWAAGRLESMAHTSHQHPRSAITAGVDAPSFAPTNSLGALSVASGSSA